MANHSSSHESVASIVHRRNRRLDGLAASLAATISTADKVGGLEGVPDPQLGMLALAIG